MTIAVATFGDTKWIDLAERRAIPSAQQFDVPVVHVHSHTLHDARNEAAALTSTEWIVYLDADDELHPRFLNSIASGTADVRAPAVAYIDAACRRAPSMPRVAGHHHNCTATCLTDGNWLVVGSAVRTDMVKAVGGWRDFPWSEDWDLWIRCWQAGATIEAVPKAIYIAHVRRDSRNRAPDRAAKLAAHQAIWEANFGAAA